MRGRLDARERRTRRLEVLVAAGIGVLGLVTAAGGAAHPGLFAVGAWLVTLAVLILWARSVRNRTERGTGPRGPSPRLPTLDGEPATAITAPATRLAVTLAMWLVVAVPLLGSGLALLVGDAPGAGALLAGAGVVALVPVALTAVGRVSPGGVWLTPSAVVVRDHGLESRIPWPALVTVADGATTDAGRGTVLLRASAAAGTIHRRRSGPWTPSVRTVGPAIALLDARWLALDAQAISGRPAALPAVGNDRRARRGGGMPTVSLQLIVLAPSGAALVPRSALVEEAERRFGAALLVRQSPNSSPTDLELYVSADEDALLIIGHFADSRSVSFEGDDPLLREAVAWYRTLLPDDSPRVIACDQGWNGHVELTRGITADQIRERWVDHAVAGWDDGDPDFG